MRLHGKTYHSASIAMKHPTLCECISALLIEKVIFPHFFWKREGSYFTWAVYLKPKPFPQEFISSWACSHPGCNRGNGMFSSGFFYDKKCKNPGGNYYWERGTAQQSSLCEICAEILAICLTKNCHLEVSHHNQGECCPLRHHRTLMDDHQKQKLQAHEGDILKNPIQQKRER